MSYDKEIAGLGKMVDLLTDAIGEIVKRLTQNFTGQMNVNKSIAEAIKAISVRVAKSEASREEMRKLVSEISKGVQLQEGMIKEIEGFNVRKQG